MTGWPRVGSLRWALVAPSVVVLVPGAIVAASLLVSAANEAAGLARYRLPPAFFWVFVTTGVASPFVGLGTLLALWLHRSRQAGTPGRVAVILVSAAAVLAPAVWFVTFAEVFFAAGGNR